MEMFLYILINNIVPIFIIILIGFLLEKRFKLDINTLSKINFYVFVPVFLFVSICESKIMKNAIIVVIFTIALLIGNFIIGKIVCSIGNVNKGKTAALQNSLMFYNSGNMGIPLITLIFSNSPFIVNGGTPFLNIALTVQLMVVLIQDVVTNTFGFINAGSANSSIKKSIKKILSMPSIYVILLIFIIKFFNIKVTTAFFWPSLQYIKNGLISIALLTLGIQLGKINFNFRDKLVYLATFIRLIIGPIIAFIIIKILSIDGILAEALLISSSMPTAVNSALIAVECDNYPEFVSQIVMLSTLLSPITITIVISVVLRQFT